MVDKMAVALGTYNGLVPAQGPRFIRYAFDFTASPVGGGSINAELTIETMQSEMGFVQTVWINNVANTGTFTLTNLMSQHSITLAAGKQGFLPMIAPHMSNYQGASSVGGAGIIVPVIFINVPMPSIVF